MHTHTRFAQDARETRGGGFHRLTFLEVLDVLGGESDADAVQGLLDLFEPDLARLHHGGHGHGHGGSRRRSRKRKRRRKIRRQRREENSASARPKP
jgi:hypothetical protein